MGTRVVEGIVVCKRWPPEGCLLLLTPAWVALVWGGGVSRHTHESFGNIFREQNGVGVALSRHPVAKITVARACEARQHQTL